MLPSMLLCQRFLFVACTNHQLLIVVFTSFTSFQCSFDVCDACKNKDDAENETPRRRSSLSSRHGGRPLKSFLQRAFSTLATTIAVKTAEAVRDAAAASAAASAAAKKAGEEATERAREAQTRSQQPFQSPPPPPQSEPQLQQQPQQRAQDSNPLVSVPPFRHPAHHHALNYIKPYENGRYGCNMCGKLFSGYAWSCPPVCSHSLTHILFLFLSFPLCVLLFLWLYVS